MDSISSLLFSFKYITSVTDLLPDKNEINLLRVLSSLHRVDFRFYLPLLVCLFFSYLSPHFECYFKIVWVNIITFRLWLHTRKPHLHAIYANNHDIMILGNTCEPDHFNGGIVTGSFSYKSKSGMLSYNYVISFSPAVYSYLFAVTFFQFYFLFWILCLPTFWPLLPCGRFHLLRYVLIYQFFLLTEFTRFSS